MVQEEIEILGHVIDSLTLSKILDNVLAAGGTYEIREFRVGKTRSQPSYARILVRVRNQDILQRLLGQLAFFGARQVPAGEADLRPAPRDGVVPEDFYVSTNLPTEICLRDKWVPLSDEEMDCAIVVASSLRRARPVPMALVKKGDLVVCGARGVREKRISPQKPSVAPQEEFSFMSTMISGERPKLHVIHGLAREMRRVKRQKRKILVVAGPAVVHTGGAPFLAGLIRAGWVNVLFAGNALAAHDIEQNLYGTSLGMRVTDGVTVVHGHENHLRAINAVRHAGSIPLAVKKGIVKRGIMHSLVTKKVPFVLAGSIRDDGPLPEVLTDTAQAQIVMRKHLKDVEVAIMIASTLHGVATGNLLSARVRTVFVDISTEAITKLADRGSTQASGLVMDGTSFLSELVRILDVRLAAP